MAHERYHPLPVYDFNAAAGGSRKLGFVARRTMKAAQELYEGVEVEGYGAVGLITYMRTDRCAYRTMRGEKADLGAAAGVSSTCLKAALL